MHMLYHRQPRKVIQALAGHRDPRSMEVYTRVFALDMAATLAVPFTGDGRDAAEILRTLPPWGDGIRASLYKLWSAEQT